MYAEKVNELYIPAVPVAQPRHRIGTLNGKGRAFEAPKSHPVHAFKATCRLVANKIYENTPHDGPVRVEAVFVLPRPKSEFYKVKPTPRHPHIKRGDIDNFAKTILDALTGLVWIDDGQVYSMEVEKHVASAVETPHVEMTITLYEKDQ